MVERVESGPGSASGTAKLNEEIRRLRRENERLQARVAEVEKENREFASLCVQVQERNTAVTNLYVASHRLHATLQASEVVVVIEEILMELVGAEEFGIFLLNQDEYVLELVAGVGAEPRLPSKRVAVGDGVIGEVARARQPMFVEPADETAREPEVPLAAIPLSLANESMGVIVIFELLRQKSGFSDVDHLVLELLASHAATALVAARLHGAMDRRLKTVQGFVELMKRG